MKRHLFTILLTSALVATLHAQLDTNNNGMSDIWERHYNNGELFDASITAEGDEDGDGQSNAAESLAGTNPFEFSVPDGYFAAQVRHVPETWSQGPGDPEPILENPEAYEISWFGVAGKKYILQGSEDLSNWIDITTRYGYDFPITEACLPQDENHESLPRFFWRVKVEDIVSEEGVLTEHERYRLGFDADPVDHLNAIPEAWLATHYAAKLMNWGGADALSLNDDPNHTGYTIAEQFAHGIGPTDDAPPGGRRWVIEVGDRGENITIPKNGTLKLGPNQSAVLLVAIASREYPEWTGPGTAKKYNDHFDWEITYNGQSKFQGSADINDYHQELEDAEGQSFQIPGLPHPSYILDADLVTNESDKEIEIGIEASVTNIGDGDFPSTLAIGLLPVELRDIKDHADTSDDVTIADWDTSQDIADNNIAWIEAHTSATDAAPRMPQLELRMPGLPEGLTIEAKLDVQYTRGNGARAARNQPVDLVRIPANGNFAQVNGDTWEIYNEAEWQTELAERGFFGGEATLTYQIKNGADIVAGPEEIDFRIGGRNRDDARCRTYIESRPNAGPQGNLWFAYAIARSESRDYNGQGSRYNQFLELPTHRRDVGRPLWGNDGGALPGGYGMFQVTGTAADSTVNIPRTEIWNWQENVHAGVAILVSKRTEADIWMARQKNADNANGVALPNHTARGVTFAEGTNRTMTDAVTMKLFNGASRPPAGFVENGTAPGFLLDPQGSGHYCYWRNASSEWALNRFNNPPAPIQPFNYVDRVCSEVED